MPGAKHSDAATLATKYPHTEAAVTDKWMERALELAREGVALASPNPTVGAVIVKNDRLVGEGFHTYAARSHAEIIALEEAGAAARGATLYVNFEPCCHTGRTGPCVAAIVAAGIRHVVAAMEDPNPAVCGRGLKQLREAGVAVETGVRKAEAQRLNEPFARWILTGRPLVTLKSALTLDGQITLADRSTRRPAHHARHKSTQKTVTWITSEESRAEVQRMRHAADALLTGVGTVLADDPRLTDRTGLPRRRKLLRVALDSHLRLPLRSNLARSADGDVLVFTSVPSESARARALRKAGVEVVRLKSYGKRLDLHAVMEELGRREILSVLLEAGAALNGAALEAGIVDKMFLFYAPKLAGSGHVPMARANQLNGARAFADLPALQNLTLHRFGPDFAVEGYLHDVYGNR